MKTIYTIISLFVFANLFTVTNLFAQNIKTTNEEEFKTLIKGDNISGYAMLGSGYSLIGNRDAIVLNARGGVIVKNVLSFGFAGSSFMNDYQQIRGGSNFESSLVGGYGGVYAELILLRKSAVHISLPTMAGLGAVSYAIWDRTDSDDFTQTGEIQNESSFFIVEPSVEVNFRLAQWLKAGAYGSYRFTTGLSSWFVQHDVPSNALDGYSVGVHVKFGKF